MKRSRILTAAAASVVLVGTGTGLAAAGHLNPLLESELSGRQEVSSTASDKRVVGDANGRGEGYVFGIDNDTRGGVVTDNSTTLCYLLIVDKIDELDQAPGNGRAAHIHRGKSGENGPVVANLAFPTGGQASDCLSEDEAGKFTAAAGPGIVADILANPQSYYFNVHNTGFPSGAIRGQLEAQGGHSHDGDEARKGTKDHKH